MPIHLYAACWNEEAIVPFFLQHYEPLADRIIVYDDESTDRTVELLRASGKVDVRPLLRGERSFLDAHIDLFENCWKESRGHADWVCLADMDEFLFHPDWHAVFAAQKAAGVTIIQALGFDIVSDAFPPAGAALATALTRGQRHFHLDKTSVFAPDAIEQTNFVVGRHCCAPTGRLVFPKQRYVQLRHYKSLGLEYVLARTHALATRLNSADSARAWSTHYKIDDETLRARFAEQLNLARPVPPPIPLTKPKQRAPKKRWWQRA